MLGMKRLLFIVLILFSLRATASHIVGGEFELIHIQELDGIERYRYHLNLIYYFDEDHGDQGNKAQDDTIFVRIFRVVDNELMMDNVAIPFSKETPVSYTQPACSYGGIKTTRQFYTTIITLPPARYNDPEGYYVVWERCCRNYTLNNILSFPPPPRPPDIIAAGQTFYLKFPPVVKDGKPFINSSPSDFPPLRDYACPSKPYYTEFGGTDLDGDKLVYSMVTPYTTNSAESYPVIQPEPYPLITWSSTGSFTFSLDRIMGGNPDLKITPDGYLTVTPGYKTGLYVFAVQCEEYRDGVKIGVTRRDFQLYVSSSCPDAEPPQVTGRKLGDTNFTAVNQSLSVSFPNTASDADRCVEIRVYDPDVLKVKDNYQEVITSLKVIPFNFKKDISGLQSQLPVTPLLLTQTDDEKIFSICFPDCPYIEGPFQIGVVAFDDACALPLGDTLLINVNIVPPLDNPPVFTPPAVTEVVPEGTIKTWDIHGTDADGDVLVDSIVGVGFNLQDYGMKYSVVSNTPGDYKAQLEWNTNCLTYDFSYRTHVIVKVYLEDQDHCSFKHPAVMTFDLTIDDGDHDPIIYSPTTDRTDTITFKLLRDGPITFDVKAKDVDNDFIVLSLKGIDFNPTDYNVAFPGASGNGDVTSPFSWPLLCAMISQSDKYEFDFQFTAVDNKNRCHIYRADTLDVIVKVELPDNTAPALTIYNSDTHLPVTDTLSYTLGNKISLDLIGRDADVNPVDFLTTDLIEATGNVLPKGYVFTPNNKLAPTNATFVWQPDCSIFENGIFTNRYTFTFKLADDRCLSSLADTSTVFIKIKDVVSTDKNFIPPNVITPNGDGCNEYFALEDFDSPNPKCQPMPLNGSDPDDDPNNYIGLPKDNCVRRFESIRIYNRWGTQVYSSHSRNFRWYASDVSVGVYFYYITYTDKIYKGSVSVLY